jgi:hypothetical protein
MNCTGRGRPKQYPVTVYRAHRANARDTMWCPRMLGITLMCRAETRTRVARVQRADHETNTPHTEFQLDSAEREFVYPQDTC